MKHKKLLIFINPEFDKRFSGGISRLYQVFCINLNCNIEIVDIDFLKSNIPENGHRQILVIAGGDGTIHKVINTIPDEAFNGYLFAIIPGGTANEFAKAMHIPKSFQKAAELIVTHKKIYFEHIGIINDETKFATGLLYGVAAQVLQITPVFAKHLFGKNAFILGLLKYLTFYWQEFWIKRREFVINDRFFRTNYLLINNASLTSKDIEKNDISIENQNEFSIVYLHSRLKLFEIMQIFVKYHTHYRILDDHALAWIQANKINLEFNDSTDFLLDGEFYKLNSPLEIRFFKYPLATISG